MKTTNKEYEQWMREDIARYKKNWEYHGIASTTWWIAFERTKNELLNEIQAMALRSSKDESQEVFMSLDVMADMIRNIGSTVAEYEVEQHQLYSSTDQVDD